MEHGHGEPSGRLAVELRRQLAAPLGAAQEQGEAAPRLQGAGLRDHPPQLRVAQRLGPELHAETPVLALARLAEGAEERADQRAESRRGVAVAGGFGERRALPEMPLPGEGRDQLLLAAEVAVDGARAQPGLAHHVVHGRAVKAGAREADARRVEDLAAPRGEMGLAHSRHQGLAADARPRRAVELVAAARPPEDLLPVLARTEVRFELEPALAQPAGSPAGSRPKVQGSASAPGCGAGAPHPRRGACRRGSRGARR